MKTQKNPAQNHRLQKRDNRWKWMAGATAATAAAATSAHAQLVQISLIDNQISVPDGDTLNADLAGTGPSLVDLAGARTSRIYSFRGYGVTLAFKAPERGVSNNAVTGYARFGANFASMISYRERIKDMGKSAGSAHHTAKSTFYAPGEAPTKIDLLIPIALSSANVNGGVLTDALLEVEASTAGHADDFVALTRVVFDKGDPTVGTATLMSEVTPGGMDTIYGTTDDGVFTPYDVPEPSGLALLALGAGGLLAWRLRPKAL